MLTTYRAWQVTGEREFSLVERELVEPEPGQVRIRVLACGVCHSDMVAAHGPRAIAEAVRALAGDGPCYLTVDIDCLEPAFAPGTGTPVAGGLMPRELMTMLRGLEELPIVGCDVVEVAPAYDQAGITALAAATVVYEQVCRVARRNGAGAAAYPAPPMPRRP